MRDRLPYDIPTLSGSILLLGFSEDVEWRDVSSDAHNELRRTALFEETRAHPIDEFSSWVPFGLKGRGSIRAANRLYLRACSGDVPVLRDACQHKPKVLLFMTNAMQLTKKAFTWSVVLLTIVWSMGVAALVAPAAAQAAECPEIEAGDLIKGSTAAVYYVDADMNRHYFLNAEVYKTWYPDYSGVQVVDDTCMGAYKLTGAVPFRPGSRMVKTVDSNAVYAVSQGAVLEQIESEAAATALYGSNWASLVRDVDNLYLPAAFTQSDDMLDGSMPHDGQLVKVSGSDTVYYMWDGMLHEVEGTLPSFLSADVRMVAQSVVDDSEMSDETITPASIVANPAAASDSGDGDGDGDNGDGDGETPAGGDVTVSLAANTAASRDVLVDSSSASEYNESNISFLTVNFKAGSEPVEVKSVKFTRTGIAADTDLGNLYLYDGDTKIAEYNSFNDKVVTFSKSSGLFEVAAGQTKAITLRGDLARSLITGDKKFGFEIVKDADVTTVGEGEVSGSFPVTGNQMTTVAVTDLGHIYITGTSTYPSTVKADEANKEFWRLTLNADSQDMEVRYVKFTMVGTIDTDEIDNLRLEVGGQQVGSAASISDDKTVVFDLSASPLKIDAGQSKIAILRGDMKGGSGRVFKFTVQKITDIITRDLEYGADVSVAVGSTTGAFTVLQPTTGNGTSVDSGTLTIGVATESPTGNIADGGSNLTLADFTFEAVGEDVKVDNLSVTCSGTGSNEVLVNVKLLLDGSQVGTTDSSLTCDNSETAAYSFGNTFIVKQGTVSHIKVVADTTGSNIASGDTLSVSLAAGSSNANGQTTLNSLSTTAQTARTLSVKSGTVSVAENPAFGDKTSTNPTGTVNAKAVKIASFVITAGSGEAVDVTQIALADNATTALASNFQNMKLMHGDTQIGSTISSLNSTVGTYTFTPATAIRLAAGEQYVVDVYADIKSSAEDAGSDAFAAVRLAATAVTATGVSTNSTANSSNSASDLQNVYIASAGNLTITLDGDSPDAAQLVLGNTGYEMAKFKLAADAAEDVNITDLIVSVSTSNPGSLKNLRLYVDGQPVSNPVNLGATAATTTYYNATFSGLTLTIPRNSNKIVTVKADTTVYDDGGASGGSFYTAMLYNVGTGNGYGTSSVEPVSALGASSGSSLTGATLDVSAATDDDVVADEMKTYKTKVTAAFASDSPSGSAVGGDDAIVAKFVVSNSANAGNYEATIENLNFAISQTGVSATASRELKVYKDSITSGNLLVTTSYGSTVNFVDSVIDAGDFTDVKVAAGASKTFIVTLDTQDAGTDDKISVGLAQSDVSWNDSSNDVTSVDGLPLTPKTLTY